MTLTFDINSGSILLTALITIVIGLVVCFFGHRLFRAYLSLIGFFIGFGIGASLFSDVEPIVQVFAGIGVGLIVGLIAYALFVVGFVVAGALLGASFGVAILTIFGIEADGAVAVIVIAALIGAGLAFVLKNLIIILSTATTGAGQVIAGGLLLLFPDNVTQAAGGLVRYEISDSITLVAVLAWVLLAIAGFASQNRSHRRR